MEDMTEQEALGMIWHMANMWLCEETQRFQQHPVTNEWEDCLGLLLESHGATSEGLYPVTEKDAEEALRIIHKQYFKRVLT